MNTSKFLQVSLIAAFSVLGGCATTHNPIPEGYTGPTVSLADTSVQENSSKGQFFTAEKINGQLIGNSLHATRGETAGKGFALQPRTIIRDVPVGPMKVELVASVEYAAPIQAMTSKLSGNFFEVRGIVDFTPVEGHKYIVTGELAKVKSCVWIADAESKELSTEKVCTK